MNQITSFITRWSGDCASFSIYETLCIEDNKQEYEQEYEQEDQNALLWIEYCDRQKKQKSSRSSGETSRISTVAQSHPCLAVRRSAGRTECFVHDGGTSFS